ncbi:hypothetical protein BOX15_Mlig032452g2 [Macrostomum lignano]|uniref:Uncharacterized protein n=1 Tax=Macrostomum lignano TaxID=282301 RepID=A0A267ESG8_9PLAT|nr:hypothetical protein BOX15_Mlig032452g2 [Macrostomum lignano]
MSDNKSGQVKDDLSLLMATGTAPSCGHCNHSGNDTAIIEAYHASINSIHQAKLLSAALFVLMNLTAGLAMALCICHCRRTQLVRSLTNAGSLLIDSCCCCCSSRGSNSQLQILSTQSGRCCLQKQQPDVKAVSDSRRFSIRKSNCVKYFRSSRSNQLNSTLVKTDFNEEADKVSGSCSSSSEGVSEICELLDARRFTCGQETEGTVVPSV